MVQGTQDVTVYKGLDTDSHPNLLGNDSLVHLVNGDIQDNGQEGSGYFVQNMRGNKECLKVGPNYLGHVRLDKNQFVIFSSPGKIELFHADNCNSVIIANEACFNFKGKIMGRYQYVNGSRRIYWVEEGGPIRYLDIDECLPKERTEDCQFCNDTYTDKVDCSATLFNKKVPQPCVAMTENTGGNIPNGVYQVAIAFSLEDRRYSDYIIFPELIRLHSNTRQHFTLTIDIAPCITGPFDTYELVLISHRVDRSTVAQRIGFYDTSQTTVSINTLDEARYEPIDFNSLLSTNPKYEGASHIATNNETLILAGLRTKPKLDYQLTALEIESEWVTMLAKPEDAHKYPSFMRDEVYGFDIAWVYPDGTESRRFHIPNDADDTDRLVEADPGDNHWEPDSECNPETRKVWEIADTSTLIADAGVSDVGCGPVERAYGKFAYWESRDELYPDGFGELSCLPIRYHKFPSNSTHGEATHIHTSEECGDPLIQVMTVRFKNIQPPVDCDGNPVTVVGYKIYVTDREGQESILSKGLLYNMRAETLASGETSYFQNYPFNDLHSDVFLGTDKVTLFNSFSPLNTFIDSRVSYISPELQYLKGQTGSELVVYAESYGSIDGEYHDAEGYPAYQILSPLGRLASQTVGFLEAKAVLQGQPCTTTVEEHVCSKLKDRLTEVSNFPTPNITGNSVGGGGTGLTGLINGTGTIKDINGGDISTSVDINDYSWTRKGDDDCASNYTLTSLEVISYQSSGTEFGNFSDTCLLKVETNANEKVTLTITLNDTKYVVPLDSNGDGSIYLNADCEPYSPTGLTEWTESNVDYSFSMDCDCVGDEQTIVRTETQNCDHKFKILSDLEWYDRLPAMMYYYSQGVGAVGDFLKSIIKPKQYAVQFTGVSNQSQVADQAYARRRIDQQFFLPSHKVVFNGEKYNNWGQCQADIIDISAALPSPTNNDYSRVLLSENDCNRTFSCANIGGNDVIASNLYVGIKRRMDNQYGNLNDYQTKQITCVLTGTETAPIFGGDVFISKHYTVRKFPLWEKLPLGLPNNTEFDTSRHPNIGFPRFWLDVNNESYLEDAIEDLPVIGSLFYDYNLDDVIDYDNCDPDLFDDFFNLLGGLGFLANWLVDISTGSWYNPFSLPGKFYTHLTGIVGYYTESRFIGGFREYNELVNSQTVETQTPKEIAKATTYEQQELFLYNLQYLWQGITKQTLPAYLQGCCDYTGEDFRMVYSLPQNDSKYDNWLNFRPNNYVDLPKQHGQLNLVREIDQYNLFIGFEDASYITQQDDGLTTNNNNQVYLGTGDAFSRRLRKVIEDDTGFGGIQDPESFVSTRYGVFWYDGKRKKFVNYGGRLDDITTRMQSWVNRYVTGPVIGVYDNYSDNIYWSVGDVGLVYKPAMKRFISLLDFGVDGFLQMANNFISLKEDSLWVHNTDNYQRLFGKTHPFEVGIILKDQFRQTQLNHIEVYAEFYKESNGYRHYTMDEFFEWMSVHNQLYTTGKRDILVKNESSMRPSMAQLGSDTVEVSMVEDFTYRLNAVDIRSTQQPIFRPIDGVRYSFGELNVSDKKPIQGKYFDVRMGYNKPGTKVLMHLGIGLNKLKQNV